MTAAMRRSEHTRTGGITGSASESAVALACSSARAFALATADGTGGVPRTGELAGTSCETLLACTLASIILFVESAGTLPSADAIFR